MSLPSLVLSLVALAAPVGKAPAPADGRVEGLVTFKGKPLDAGRILFHLDDGEFVGAKVKDGRYKVSRVPAGVRRVTVEGKGVPAKYGEEETSGVKVEVKRGEQTFDIDLT